MRSLFKEFLTRGDKTLLCLCLFASFFGVFLQYSATQWTGTDTFVTKQAIAICLGVIIYQLLSIIDFRPLLEQFWKQLFLFNMFFLLLLKTPLGDTLDSGNLNWLVIPFIPFDIQPNEIIKVTYIMLTAHFLSSIQAGKRSINTIPSLLQLGIHAAITIGMIALICGDWGMCVIYVCITLMMLWCAGLHILWFVAGFSVIGSLSYVIWTFFLPTTAAWDSNYLIMRFRVLFDHSLDPLNIGWQQSRSIMTLGSGQLFGQGYLQGIRTQSTYSQSLPARHTDFIFAVCGEELGLMGCLLLLVVLFAIILRCIWIAHHVDSYFAAYVAFGTAAMLLAQVFFNVGMCLYIMPVMGLTLPFFSYGGSSIITLYATMGVVSSLKSRTLPRWIRDRGQLMF